MGEFSAFVIISFLISYVIPSIIALFRAKSHTFAIILLNLFFGWTFIGWVVALVWAATKDLAPIQKPLDEAVAGFKQFVNGGKKVFISGT